jgi:hypothetical protein
MELAPSRDSNAQPTGGTLSDAEPVLRPVSLTPACVRAIMAGRKRQIRSIAHPPNGVAPPVGACPLGRPGDLLRVREGLSLRIASTRLERLQSIRDEDLAAEGGMWQESAPAGSVEDERDGFARWWNEVHVRLTAKWEADPWVWVIEFEVMPCT